MPLCGRATARNFPKFLEGLRSHIGSCSLEGPRLSRDPTFPRSGVCAFVPRGWSRRRRPRATGSGGISICRSRHHCVCTTHVLRRGHQRAGECSETGVTASAAEKRLGALVPSSAKTWRHSARSPVSPRCGGGAAHVNRARRSPHLQEPERRSNPRPKDPGTRASVLRRVP